MDKLSEVQQYCNLLTILIVFLQIGPLPDIPDYRHYDYNEMTAYLKVCFMKRISDWFLLGFAQVIPESDAHLQRWPICEWTGAVGIMYIEISHQAHLWHSGIQIHCEYAWK